MKYSIPSKQSMYRGLLFDSVLERKTAQWLDHYKIQYAYHPIPGGICAEKGREWRPDFRLMGLGYLNHDTQRLGVAPDIYVEIKPVAVPVDEMYAWARTLLEQMPDAWFAFWEPRVNDSLPLEVLFLMRYSMQRKEVVAAPALLTVYSTPLLQIASDDQKVDALFSDAVLAVLP